MKTISAGESKEEVCLLLDKTPFMQKKVGKSEMRDLPSHPGVKFTKNTLPGPSEGQILHIIEIKNGSISTGDRIKAVVDKKEEQILPETIRNPSPSAGIKGSAGRSYQPGGSLSSPDRLRFDLRIIQDLLKMRLKNRKTINEAILKICK